MVSPRAVILGLVLASVQDQVSSLRSGEAAASGLHFIWPCETMGHVLKCGVGAEREPWLIGKGSEGYLFAGLNARDDPEEPREVLVKLVKEYGEYSTLTRADLEGPGREGARRAAEEARHECEVGLDAMAAVRDGTNRNAQRIRGCYGHNLDAGHLNETLYIKLPHAGTISLNRATGGRFDTSAALKIFKMLLEAFEALSSLQWVMHDIHSENVMLSRSGGGEYYLKLIDFGSAIKSMDQACGPNAGKSHCNAVYAPPEFSDGRGSHAEFDVQAGCDRPAFDPAHPSAFDMYGVGRLFFELLVKYQGTELHGTWHNYWEPWVAKHWDKVAKSHEDLERFRRLKRGSKERVKLIVDRMADGFADDDVLAMFNSHHDIHFGYMGLEIRGMEHAAGFVRECAKLLSLNPADRPKAADLLQHPFMQAVKVPDEQIW